LKNKLEVAEQFGTTPLRILMEIATHPESSKEEVIQCAIAAAPYCHPRLKQVEISDNRTPRSPEQIERDITQFAELISRRQRDLIGTAD
jgi:hypothetical protein